MKFNTIADSFDYFILTIVIFCLLGDFITLCSSLINHVFDHFNMSGSDLISCMVDNSTSTTICIAIFLLVSFFVSFHFRKLPVYSNDCSHT